MSAPPKCAFKIVAGVQSLQQGLRAGAAEQAACSRAILVFENKAAGFTRYAMADGSSLLVQSNGEDASRILYAFDYDSAESLRAYAEWLGEHLASELDYINARLADLGQPELPSA